MAGKGRPFQKGQSGNPGGRAKGAGLADYIRTQTKDGHELADFMVAILRNDKDGELGGRVPLPVRMEAATWLADRGFGKPVQATELNADVNVSGRIVYAPALATIPEGT